MKDMVKSEGLTFTYMEETEEGQTGAEMKKALDSWLDDVAAGLTGLVHIFNPELVLVGGGVSAQEELLIEPLRQKVRAGVMPRFGERLRVERATLGNDAGMIGALRWWLDQEEDYGG